jgi:hypothetical protein
VTDENPPKPKCSECDHIPFTGFSECGGEAGGLSCHFSPKSVDKAEKVFQMMSTDLAREEAIQKQMGEWLDRELPDKFFTTPIPVGEHQKRFDEIPEAVKPLAFAIINTAIEMSKKGVGGPEDGSCCAFRNVLFSVCHDLKEKGTDLHLPYYWFADGVMIEPEWIVRLTNGLVKWVCDSSRRMCLLTDTCRFYTKETIQKRMDTVIKDVE